MTHDRKSLDEYVAEQEQQAVIDAVTEEAGRSPEGPSITRRDHEISIVAEPGELGTPEDLMRRRGIDPEIWTPAPVGGLEIKEWESAAKNKAGDGWIAKTNHLLRLKLNLKSSLPHILRIDCPGAGKRAPATHVKPDGGLIAFLSDQQVMGPGLGYDPDLHECVCRWLERHRKELQGVVIGGDVANGTAGSRHPQTIAELASGNAELAASHALLHDYRKAAGDCWMGLTGGNHEAHWLQSQRRGNNPQADIHPAGDETLPAIFSMTNLLRLDTLNIEEAAGEYPHAQLMLSPYLAARHGWIAVKGSGASALATLNHLGYSVVVGHTHRQGIVYKTVFEIDGRRRTLCAVESGTLAKVDSHGLGYAVTPDWQPGFAVFHMAPDGTFSPSLASWVNQTLIWEGERYTYDAGSVRIAA